MEEGGRKDSETPTRSKKNEAWRCKRKTQSHTSTSHTSCVTHKQKVGILVDDFASTLNYNSEGESGLLIRVLVPRVRKRRTNYLSPVKLLSPGSGRKFV